MTSLGEILQLLLRFPMLLWLFSLLYLVANGRATSPTVWVCSFPFSSSTTNEVHPHSRDCDAYVTCQNGYPRVMSCPLGLYFHTESGICDWPTHQQIQHCEHSISYYSKRICEMDRYARIPVPDSCALYLDCSLPVGNPIYYDKMLECPYPDLFAADLRQCVKFWQTKCGHRPVPVAPCDYLQYRQSCTKVKACLPCPKRHPSCRRQANGPQPVKEHGNLFKLCSLERTLDVRKCHDFHVYHSSSRKCIPVK